MAERNDAEVSPANILSSTDDLLVCGGTVRSPVRLGRM